MVIGWPEGIWLGFVLMAWFSQWNKSGLDLGLATLVLLGETGLLYWGGFFS